MDRLSPNFHAKAHGRSPDGREPPGRLDDKDLLLEVRDVTVEFPTGHGSVRAVDNVSFELRRGETLGLVGESGSGKSVTALTMLRLLPRSAKITKGQVVFEGQDLLRLSARAMRRVRGSRVALIFQDPQSSLNPVLTVGRQVSEALRVHRGLGKRAARKAAIEQLERVQIPEAARRYDQHPHELSGGMRQRAMIAMALALRPRLLIADEPTTALDVTVQAEILSLLEQLKKEEEMAMILISHDLRVVSQVAERLAVMYLGRLVEMGLKKDLFLSPRHPYTLGLMRSLPQVRVRSGHFETIEGSAPSLRAIPTGCPFHPRCPMSRDRCENEPPALRIVDENRYSACHFSEEISVAR